VDLADLVLLAGVEEDPFGHRRFARIDMRRNADISCFFQGIFSWHG
jgi:hypothetical protein